MAKQIQTQNRVGDILFLFGKHGQQHAAESIGRTNALSRVADPSSCQVLGLCGALSVPVLGQSARGGRAIRSESNPERRWKAAS